MNKCEQAQINIDKAISEIKGTYERVKSHGFRFKEGLPTL